MTEEPKKMKSIRTAYKGHCTQDFKSWKTDTFREPRWSRIGSASGQTYTKRYRYNTNGYKNSDDIEDRRRNPNRHGISVNVSRQYIILAIQKLLLKSKQDIPVSQVQHSYSKQTPTARMHVNLPKINMKSFGEDPLELLIFWDSFRAAIDKKSWTGWCRENELSKRNAYRRRSARYLRTATD